MSKHHHTHPITIDQTSISSQAVDGCRPHQTSEWPGTVHARYGPLNLDLYSIVDPTTLALFQHPSAMRLRMATILDR